MQCVNCQFFNVPGSQVCGRCGTTLRFDTLDVSVEPPRAGRAVLLPRVLGITAWNRLRYAAASVRRSSGLLGDFVFGADMPTLGAWGRMLVPGWPLRTAGLTAAGWAVLGGWVVLLVLSALYLGTQLGGILFGLTFALHHGAAVSSFPAAGLRRIHLMRVGLLLAALLALAVYLPGQWVVNQVVQPVTIDRNLGPFQEGDVVLYYPWRERWRTDVQAGQWVVFDVPTGTTVRGLYQGGQNIPVVVQPGTYLTRVLAVPGSVVAWDGEVLTVDGEPSRWQPRPVTGAKPRRAIVPKGKYFVAPWLTGQNRDDPHPAPVVANVPFDLVDTADPARYIAAGQVRGRVFRKLHPLSESHRIR